MEIRYNRSDTSYYMAFLKAAQKHVSRCLLPFRAEEEEGRPFCNIAFRPKCYLQISIWLPLSPSPLENCKGDPSILSNFLHIASYEQKFAHHLVQGKPGVCTRYVGIVYSYVCAKGLHPLSATFQLCKGGFLGYTTIVAGPKRWGDEGRELHCATCIARSSRGGAEKHEIF